MRWALDRHALCHSPIHGPPSEKIWNQGAMTSTIAIKDTDVAAAAALLLSRFRGRTDVYLVERNGRIRTVKSPLTDEVIISHLNGELRVGCFPIQDGMTWWLSWDIDHDDRSMVKALLEQCAKWGLSPLLERSKSKGFHVWVLLSEFVPAKLARDLALKLMRAAGIQCEIFPKQDHVNGDGVGNAVFLPWQGKSVSEKRTIFIDPQSFEPYTDQLNGLRFHERLPREWIEAVSDMCRESAASPQCPVLLEEAIRNATNGTRNDIGFQLACNLRDTGLPQAEAEPLMRTYAKAVTNRGVPEYTEREALSSLQSAYSKSRKMRSGDGHQSLADKLVDLAVAHAELFHTEESAAYAVISNGTHNEVWPLKSKHFKRWLSKNYFAQYGKVPNATSIGDAILALEGRALFSSPEDEVYLRIAEYQGKIIIDLCNEAWECVAVDSSGWRLTQNPPVKFRRSRGMLALRTPVLGTSLDELRKFINLASEEEWRLLVVWVLYVLRGRGPYLVLILQGEQGSGKTTTVLLLRAITDPNVSPLRSEPKEARDLFISATNCHVLAFDNLSSIAPWFSDVLCLLSTGGGYATRELYENQEEVIFKAKQPVILNGIEALPTRSDLLDRTLFLTLPTINDETRRSEGELLENFEAVRPQVFGALLTALSKTLQALPTIKLDRLPRMADFAIFGVAVERALGWPQGSFLHAYENNRREAHSIALEGSSIAGPIEELMSARHEWEGTATDLLDTLRGIASFEVTRRRGWPVTPRQLANQLTRLAPNLRSVGITVRKERTGHAGTRKICLEREEKTKGSEKIKADESMHDNGKGSKGVENANVNEGNGTIHQKVKALSKMWKRVKPQHERK
jgi:hypothetical protein